VDIPGRQSKPSWRGPPKHLPGYAKKDKRWCVNCVKAHPEALDFRNKCEDCEQRLACRGLPAPWRLGQKGPRPSGGKTVKRRWCVPCSASHPGAVAPTKTNPRPKCEDCGTKRAVWKRPGDAQFRWCTGCRAAHEGAVAGDSEHRPCEGAAPAAGAGAAPCARTASCGTLRVTVGVKRWCATAGRPRRGVYVLPSSACSSARAVHLLRLFEQSPKPRVVIEPWPRVADGSRAPPGATSAPMPCL
jgi:hypothetical protein